MIELREVDQVVEKAASVGLGRADVKRAFSEPGVDSEGREALRVTIVLGRGAMERVSGDSALDTLVRIQRDLRGRGEERLPIVEFVTEEELEESGDPES